MSFPGIPVILGTAELGSAIPLRDSVAVLDAYASLGGRMLDTANNYAFAVLVVAIASTLSALVVLRKLSQLNLIGVLKAPE